MGLAHPSSVSMRLGGAVLGTMLLWAIVETPRAGAAMTDDMASAVMMLCAAGAAIGLCVGLAASALGLAVRHAIVPTTRLGRRLRELATAAPLISVGVMVVINLASGAGISADPGRRALLLIAGIPGTCVAAWIVSATTLKAFSRPCTRRFKVMFAAAAVVAAGAAAFLDAAVFPRQYAVFHRGLVVVFAIGSAAAGATLIDLGPRRGARVASVSAVSFGLISVLAFAAGLWPGDDLSRRRVIRLHAPMTARIASVVLPAHQRPEPAISSQLATALGPPDPLPDAFLDAMLPERARFNVMWITIDTMRADRLGRVEGGSSLTPHLDAFAKNATVFSRAYAQYPSSQLSMSSMFQGVYPEASEIFTRRRDLSALGQPLSIPPIAQRLRDAGYVTEAVCALPRNYVNRLFPFLEHGFQEFNPFPWSEALDAATVTARAQEALARVGENRWMLWAHYFDPHSPYVRRAEFDAPESEFPGYDSEIRYTDHHLRDLLATLRSRPDWDRTIVIVHSDHGEELLDHNGTHHGSSLYEEQVHVPLVVRIPGLEGARRDETVELIDIVPTILEAIQSHVPAELHGHSLLRLMLPDTPEGRGPADAAFFQFSEPNATSPVADGVRRGRLKAILHRGSDLVELYDLQDDPDERTDLGTRAPDLQKEARALVSAFQVLRSGSNQSALAERDEATVRAAVEEPIRDLARGALIRMIAARRLDLVERCADALLDSDQPDRIELGLEACTYLPGVADEERLAALCAHGNPLVRLRAALALAALDLTEIPRALLALSASEIPTDVAAGHVARALLGDASAGAAVAEIAKGLSGRERALCHIALARIDAPGAMDRLASLIRQRTDDIELQGFAMRTMERTADPVLLEALFSSVEGLSINHWRKNSAALVPPLARYPIDLKAPLLRLDLRSRDPAGRSEIKALIGDHATAPWEGSGVQILQKMSSDDGKAAEAFVAACRRSQRDGIIDWTHATHAWRRLLRSDQLERAKTIAREIRLPSAATSWSASFVRRLEAVAAALDRPPKPLLKITHLDPIPEVAGNLALLELSVTAQPAGGSLIGGHPGPGARLIGSVGDDIGTRLVTTAALPTPGLLPGETSTVVVAFRHPKKRSGPANLVVRLRHAPSVSIPLK